MPGQAIYLKTVELNVNFFNSNGINALEPSCHGWLINFKKNMSFGPNNGEFGQFLV